jgi:hypothetical protein
MNYPSLSSENFGILIDEKFPTACADCKHCHRKCDRGYPSCGYCTKKGKKCVYNEKSKVNRPRLKPKKTQDIKNEKIGMKLVPLPSPIQMELTRANCVSVHHEYCINQLHFYLPILSHENILVNLEFLRARGMGECMDEIIPPKQEALALTFCIICKSHCN